MTDTIKISLSVSRRTDIPAFYMPWFMDGVARGEIAVQNPFNRQVRQVPVSPSRIHTIVFWSKNFGPFLDGGYGERLRGMGFGLYFNFSVNSHAPELEPAVPPLDDRLGQLRELARRFGGQAVQWRFDPICHFVTADGRRQDNLADFATIADAAASSGIPICITSFMDHYRKIRRRLTHGLHFRELPTAEKTAILQYLEAILMPMGIELAVCCENDVLAALPPHSAIRAAACISGRRMMDLYGGRVSLRQDVGQRKASGCGCTEAVDIGSYAYHPCHHNCLFCYANPARDQRP
jgi:hypothetical protein